jgi:serine/threonine protein kinase/formylglycine-generating enzyme required for sulfatase activity
MSESESSLEEVILAYLKAGDAGRPANPRAVLAHHPEMAEELEEFFAIEEELGPLLSPLRVLPPPGAPQSTGPNLKADTPGEAGDGSPAVADRPPAIPGYEVLGELGRGGMGVVYKARQISLNRVVALKVIRSRRLKDPDARARFQAEARAVARLHHPNILQVWDHGEQDCQPYLSLEYIDAGSLADWRKERPRPPREVAALVALLADAVEHAHQEGIVHRDLKPANILLTAGGVPKVADFGLARPTQAEEAGLTRPGEAVGTPPYMAPEQAEGRLEAVGPLTDVFGLGAILYELLTGQPPYRGATVEDVIDQARQGRITPPRRLRARVPRALECICRKAMAADPQQRYTGAASLAADLRRYLHPSFIRPSLAVTMACLLLAGLAVWIAAGQLGVPPPGDTPASRPAPAPETPPPSTLQKPPPEPSAQELAAHARSVLENNCYRCHGKDGAVESGLNYVLDPPQLVARRLIVPGKPETSRLFQRVKKGEMPPAGAQPRPSAEDIAALEKWVRAGAPDFNPSVPRRLLTAADVLEAIRKDLDKANRKKRIFLRYFTITHLYNAGLPEDGLQTYRSALSKLVNSLSWHQEITTPVDIDPERTVFRIDLREYGWTDAVWRRILAEYPYGVTYRTETAEYCCKETQCPLPHVRADWFVFAASRPPLYHEVLQLPGTDTELEDRLRIDVKLNRQHGKAVRAAFNGSGVAHNNRMIERHPNTLSGGAYWKSFDFKAYTEDTDRRNLFTHPLGPGPEAGAFRHDGGEIIFNLPNGLQGYLLVDRDGKRVDRGPTDLVKDPRQKEGAVINGISCMSCHVRGMIEKTDQIREHVENQHPFFKEDVVEKVMDLYPPRVEFKRFLETDTERFARAVRAATDAPPGGTDPIVALASRYEWELDQDLAAAEAGLEKAEFLKELARSKELGPLLGALQNEGGTVQRAVWANEFGKVVHELRLGKPYRAEPATEDDSLKNSIGMKLKRIPNGTFRMGTPGQENKDEHPHEVKITRPFFIGIYEVTQEEFLRVMGTNPSHFKKDRDASKYPVESVSWKDAVEFCKRLSERREEKVHQRHYRLPTEAEWEYACRAGTDAPWSFGDRAAALREHGWFDGNSGGKTHPVGEKKPNPWGLHDMHGNVREWCADYYDEAIRWRVLRGGSFNDSAERCRSAVRRGSIEDSVHVAEYGFRVVLEIDK